jgi:dUTP pyrophosphatase
VTDPYRMAPHWVYDVPCKRVGAANLPLPVYAKPGDSGLDIRADLTWFARSTTERDEHGRPVLGRGAQWIADDEIYLFCGARIAIGCGFAFETPPGTEWQVRPRSGHSRDGIDSVLGTVDSAYRGEVVMIVINNSAWGAKIRHGMRLSQIVLAPVLQARLVEVEELGETERNETGFGSSGVR